MDTVFSLTCAFNDAQDYAESHKLIGLLGTLQWGEGCLTSERLISVSPLVKDQEGFGQLHSQAPLGREIALGLA